MEYPKISIVTPNYNQAAYLEQTILSVLNQGYPNLEYIIIDGGSTDGSVDIIKKYSNNLAYWVSEPDMGMYYAIQKGFDKSTGEIMAWINSDDMYHPGALFIVADIFSSFSDIEWLIGASTTFDEKGRTVDVSPNSDFSKYDYYLYQFKWIQQESTFWRRSLWEKSGGKLNCRLKYAGDFALWISFFSFTKIYCANALLGGFRQRSCNQLTLDYLDKYIAEVRSVITDNPLNDLDRKILKKYKTGLSIVKIIKVFKLIRTDWILPYFKDKSYYMSIKVQFNRFTQQFEIKP